MHLCPEDRDETAEAFVMKRLSDEEAILFESHLMTCHDCRRAVKCAEDYIAAMRATAVHFDEEQR
jgi:hypothetical protein